MSASVNLAETGGKKKVICGFKGYFVFDGQMQVGISPSGDCKISGAVFSLKVERLVITGQLGRLLFTLISHPFLVVFRDMPTGEQHESEEDRSALMRRAFIPAVLALNGFEERVTATLKATSRHLV